MTPPRAGEFDLIARYFAPLARGGRVSAFDLRDDAASLQPRPGHDLVFTADALVADVHFFAQDPPDLIARKALRTNLSDLAAKGARPIAYLLCLALPGVIDERWIAEFARGLAEDQARFELTLAGGDTTSTPGSLVVAVTAIGQCHAPTGVDPGEDAAPDPLRRLGSFVLARHCHQGFQRLEYLSAFGAPAEVAIDGGPAIGRQFTVKVGSQLFVDHVHVWEVHSVIFSFPEFASLVSGMPASSSNATVDPGGKPFFMYGSNMFLMLTRARLRSDLIAFTLSPIVSDISW